MMLLLVVVDIDECAPGGIAASCNAAAGGVCEGHLPDRKFLCTCQPGFELDPTGVTCNGLYQLHAYLVLVETAPYSSYF